MSPFTRRTAEAAVSCFAFALTACGGGGGGGGGGPPPSSWTPGVFLPSMHFAAQCASPRSGTDPITHQVFPDTQGSATSENNWLRSWTNELYLWYSEVPDLDPALSTTAAYFPLLKTSATTPSGRPKDRFHFTQPTASWEALSQSGVQAGYGAQWLVVVSTPPRQVVVAYTQPNSPASTAPANIARGATVLKVDGADLVNGADVSILNAGLFPANLGETHTFVIQDVGSTATRTVSLISENVLITPVLIVITVPTATGPVGYIQFTDHIATAEQELIDAINKLKAANITDLLLDMRYNGGGYLDIASELAFMIAGPGPTTGASFELQQFNSKNPSTNPVTGHAITPTPFHSTAVFANIPTALPFLGLARVFVLTGSSTCSASESVINSLEGVGVEVIQIGSTTCGKPYGFYPQDNCGTTYFSIEFSGINAKGFGDYPDGFSPANTQGLAGVSVPGCSVADDFNHALGDPTEGRLAAALGYRATTSCPIASGQAAPHEPLSLGDGVVAKSAWHTNRITRP